MNTHRTRSAALSMPEGRSQTVLAHEADVPSAHERRPRLRPAPAKPRVCSGTRRAHPVVAVHAPGDGGDAGCDRMVSHAGKSPQAIAAARTEAAHPLRRDGVPKAG